MSQWRPPALAIQRLKLSMMAPYFQDRQMDARRWNFLRDIAAPTAAIFSAIAASLNVYVAAQNRATPFQVTLRIEQIKSLQDYASSSSAFQSSLKRGLADLPSTVDDIETFDALTDKQLDNFGKAAFPIQESLNTYVQSLSAVAAIWDDRVAEQIGISEPAARAAANCLYLLSFHAHDAEHDAHYFTRLRERAAPACQGAHSSPSYSEYDRVNRATLSVMTAALRAPPDTKLGGAGPVALFND